MLILCTTAIAIATITIFIRCVYRVAELNEGFNGHLANDEVLFMILEGPMIIIACIVLTVCHPGIAFAGRWAEAQPGKKSSMEDEYERAKVGSNSSIELTGP